MRATGNATPSGSATEYSSSNSKPSARYSGIPGIVATSSRRAGRIRISRCWMWDVGCRILDVRGCHILYPTSVSMPTAGGPTLLLSASDIEGLLDHRELLELLRGAMCAYAASRVAAQRAHSPIPGAAPHSVMV